MSNRYLLLVYYTTYSKMHSFFFVFIFIRQVSVLLFCHHVLYPRELLMPSGRLLEFKIESNKEPIIYFLFRALLSLNSPLNSVFYSTLLSNKWHILPSLLMQLAHKALLYLWWRNNLPRHWKIIILLFLKKKKTLKYKYGN